MSSSSSICFPWTEYRIYEHGICLLSENFEPLISELMTSDAPLLVAPNVTKQQNTNLKPDLENSSWQKDW